MAKRLHTSSSFIPWRPRTAAGITALLLGTCVLAGCGSSDSTPAAAPPPAGGGDTSSVTTDVPVTVIDGPIANATVCLDTNLNGACDAGEPGGRTGVDGKFTLAVPHADVGKYPIVAVVGVDAVDRDHGPVTVPFTLKAPADRSAVVSPLTTLVQAQIDSSGGTSGDAEAQVKAQLGLSTSLFDDFTLPGDPASQQAATMARLVVVVTQQQNTAVQGAIGQPDISGGTVSQQDLDRAVSQTLLGMLPSFADALANQVGSPSADQLAAAIDSAASTLVGNSGLAADNVAAVVGGNKLIEQSAQADAGTPQTSATVGWSVRWFQFSDVNNWFVRAFETTDAQAVPDGNGLVRFTEGRGRMQAGVEQWWGEPGFTRTDVSWDGSQWWNCPTDFEHTQTLRDAGGVSTSYYCKNQVSVSKRGVRDITGATLSEIVREIRAYPLSDPAGRSLGGFANWGPNPDSGVLGTATFPTGSKLHYQTNTDLSYADAYEPANQVSVFAADVASGSSCPDAPVGSAATSLEEVVSRGTGTPCDYPISEASGSRNEWWGNSTVSIGSFAVAAPALPMYAPTRNVRVSFGSGNVATYYSCAVRASNDSPRNCDVAGTGGYSIETLGDARVMRLSGVPAIAASIPYERLLVERGGKVHYGSRVKPQTSNSIRLNDKAASAIFTQLGLSELAD